MDIEPTLAFARRLAARKRPIWVRFVLVPGLTDDPANIAGIAGVRGRPRQRERVDVLPFHQMGKFKWERLGLDYTLGDRGAADRRGRRTRLRSLPQGRAHGQLIANQHWAVLMKTGADLLRDKRRYRSLAFTREEREQLGLRGLLPFPVVDQAHLVERVMMALRKQPATWTATSRFRRCRNATNASSTARSSTTSKS